MAKFNARKGIALAAASVLGASLLAAAPAQAAGELTLVPAAGTKWAVPSTNGFGVKAYFSAGYSSSEAAKLKFMVTADGGASVDADSSTSAVYAASTDLLSGTGLTSAVLATAGGSPTYAAFEMENNTGTATETITVQAWIDADADGSIDTGEWTSSTETITFLKLADVNWTLDIVNPTEGDTTATARVTSTNINLAQLDTNASGDVDSQVAAVFYDGSTLLYTDATSSADGSSYDGASGADGDNAAEAMTYNADEDRLEATSAATTALAAADSIKADVFFEVTAAAEASGALDRAVGGTDGLATGTANDAVEVTRTEAVAASKVTALGDVTSTATSTNTATASNAVSVRTGATSLVATSTATYESGVTSASVTFRISESSAASLVSGASVTAGGETLSNANSGKTEYIDVTVTADAEGVATLNMSLAGMTNTVSLTNVFTIVASAESHTGTLATYTVADGTAAALYNTNAVGVDGDSGELVFPVGSAFTLNYSVLDTFGAPLAVAGHTVTVSDGTNSWSANVANGVAAITVPAYSAATTKTFTPTVYKNGSDVSITEPTAEVTIGTSNAAASVTATGDSGNAVGSKKALNLKASTASDTRTGGSTPAVTSSTNVVVTGNVKDSNLDGVATSVTLSSPGLLFEADGVWAIGSITVQTSAAGAYSVDVRSNFAGKKVVTVTSGAASTTEELWFADAADDKGATLTINAPVAAAPGTTLQITGSLVDAFGNPVTADGTGEDLVFTYSGPGYAGAVPTAVSADGTFSYNVLLGSNDSGTATITVAYDLDEDGDYTDTGDIVVSKTVIIGSAPVTQKVNAGSFKGYVAVYAKGYEGHRLSAKVGKDWVIVPSIPAATNDLYRYVEFTGAGVDVAVRIYIDRVLVDTINLTTK